MKVTLHLYINRFYFFIREKEIKEDVENNRITLSINPFTDSNKDLFFRCFGNDVQMVTIQEREFSLNLGRMSFYILVNPKLIHNELDDMGNITLVISYSKFIKTDCVESTIRDLKLEELIS